MTIDPRTTPIERWCDAMVLELRSLGQVPILQDETQWRLWGQQVLLIPGVARFNPPNPLRYEEFVDWACAFNLAVSL